MQKWEHIVAKMAYSADNRKTKVKAVNGRELLDWKKGSLWDGLNQLGERGWELIGVHWTTFEKHRMTLVEPIGEGIRDPLYIFKRPKAE